ncbi:hypothetical protein HDK77DRAFT_47537 [Phyllosticta capitalensis]|uniref:Uncharacterized protein n=1 Tax=Phyllosticta capitalensis TaxID=121624 RepID=A0ABR1YB38_9PEZI
MIATGSIQALRPGIAIPFAAHYCVPSERGTRSSGLRSTVFRTRNPDGGEREKKQAGQNMGTSFFQTSRRRGAEWLYGKVSAKHVEGHWTPFWTFLAFLATRVLVSRVLRRQLPIASCRLRRSATAKGHAKPFGYHDFSTLFAFACLSCRSACAAAGCCCITFGLSRLHFACLCLAAAARKRQAYGVLQTRLFFPESRKPTTERAVVRGAR